MRKPYRVIVWGPGAVGGACLRELVRRPEFEVVAVFGYSVKKAGMDVGELINHASIGVKVSTDKEAIFNMDADCVLWTGMPPIGNVGEEMDQDVIRLLESGKHVVTPVAYHYPPSHGTAYAKKFEDACRKGKSCLHGTGENPGFWFERIALGLTGVCNDVEYIKLDEYADCSGGMGPEVLQSAGFGLTVEEASKSNPFAELCETYYFVETLNLASMTLYGKPLDRFEIKSVYHVAEKEFVLKKTQGDQIDFLVRQGYVGAVTQNFIGHIGGEPRLRISGNWFLKPANSPFTGKEDSTWDIEIEGKPTSLKCTIRALASVKDHLECRPGDPTSPTWYATAVPMLQAIPIVCSHEPGIVYASIFASCAPDLRMLETRKSIAG